MSIFRKAERLKNETAVTEQTAAAAYETLQKYKAGRASLEARIIGDEQWWKLRHYDNSGRDTVASAWLFNSVANKHADAMDSIPSVTCLPREEGDRESASVLSEILPVIFEQNSFEETYSECWYDKLKSGTACYGVFWNPRLDRGLGNIDIRRVDLLNLYFEPGVTDIQQSRNVFHVELWDTDVLMKRYPDFTPGHSSPIFDTARYIYDDACDTSGKTAVIDWYYKKDTDAGTVLHFAKLAAGQLLYASENDSRFADRGFYDHGRYPFVLDKLYSVKGTPCGFGVIDVMRGTQNQIDELGTAVVKNARMASARRYFVRSDGTVNEKEFADWQRAFVHYSGSGDPNSSIMPIETPALSQVYVAILNNKIEELKETSGNRDFSQGGTAGGVTAASAISALQEAGSKTARDMISSTYRAYEEICLLAIELIRQFYGVPRCMRITGADGAMRFVYCSGELFGRSGDTVYDIKVRAHKKSAFSRVSQNELAESLYKLGMFNPEYARQAEICLEMMEFEGKDEVLRRVRAAAASPIVAATAGEEAF